MLVFVEANAHVTHVMSLSAQAARERVVGLLEAIDIAAPEGDDDAWWGRGVGGHGHWTRRRARAPAGGPVPLLRRGRLVRR